MRISAEFLPHGQNAAAEEAATVARIRILMGIQNATDMRIDRQNAISEYVVAPAYALAEAISYRWWTLIYGRGRTTSLLAMRAGFALPNILIKPLGNGNIEVQCEPYVYDNPAISFVTAAKELVVTRDFERDMTAFLDVVANQLDNEKVPETPLSIRRTMIAETMADPEQIEFCKAAGSFGVDPYMCGDEISASIEAAASKFEADNLEEFLAGVPQEASRTALSWLQDAEQHADDWSVLPEIENCRRAIRYRQKPGAPWTAGYESARTARQVLGFDSVMPVGSLTDLARHLGNARFHATERSSSGLRGVSWIKPGKPQAIVAGNRNPASLLFAMVRTVGDAVHFGSASRSPVTDQIGTYRQQLNRAFAAEFLAPIQAITGMREDGEAPEDIAAHFGVSEMVIGHQMENQARPWLV